MWGWSEGCGTHRHHDPSVSFGTLEAIQSWATLKPTEDALVKPLPTGQPGPCVLSHVQSKEHQHLQVVRGGQILLCVLAVLWAPRGKTNTNHIRKEQKLKGQGDGGAPQLPLWAVVTVNHRWEEGGPGASMRYPPACSLSPSLSVLSWEHMLNPSPPHTLL